MNLTEIKQKGIKITLDGKEMLLRYDLNAFAYLEAKLGKDWLNKDMSNLRLLKHFLRAGLLHNYDNDKYYDNDDYNSLKPTLSQVGRMVDMDALMTLPDQIIAAMEAALPEKTEDEGENSPGEQR